MKFMKDEEAVSPVIGVILMVAITVILAAVIAAFVFGLGSGVSKTKNVAVTAKQTTDATLGDIVEITLQGGADFDTLKVINGTVGAGDCTELADAAVYVGAIMTCDGATSGSDHVIIIATFMDGAQQVVLDTYV